MPAGKSLYGIIQGNEGWFGFDRFVQAGNWRALTDFENQAHRFAILAVDEAGNYLL